MKRYYYYFLLVLLCSCNEQIVFDKEEMRMDENSNTSIKEVERKFSKAIHGIPLIIPLPEESDPTLSLMPVSEYKDNPEIDRLYLVDETQDEFCFERDIYEINYVIVMTEEAKYTAVVSSLADDTQQEFDIDQFMLNDLYMFKTDKWLKSNLNTPIIYDGVFLR